MSGITRMITGKASPEQAQALEMQKAVHSNSHCQLGKARNKLKGF